MKVNVLEDINQIKKMVFKLPAERVKEVENFVEFVYTKASTGQMKGKVEKLEGIWEGLGFEKISNIEQEIDDIRQEVENWTSFRGRIKSKIL